jgi:hypothetical protein
MSVVEESREERAARGHYLCFSPSSSSSLSCLVFGSPSSLSCKEREKVPCSDEHFYFRSMLFRELMKNRMPLRSQRAWQGPAWPSGF